MTKVINKVLVGILFLIIIFFTKDDIRSFYTHGAAYFKNKLETISNNDSNNLLSITKNAKSNDTSKVSIKDLSIKAQTPGPLKVFTDLINPNSTDKIKLSSTNVINLTNQNRKENGNLSPLKENAKLDISAKEKLQDMFAQQYFEHVSPNGVSVVDLGNQVGYEYITIGENLAIGNFSDDKALVDAWMASPGHRANILNKHYTEIGVAVGKGVYQGKSVWMAVQHFGLPKSICPSVDEVLHGSIDIDQANIKSMEADLSIRKQYIDSGAVHEGMTTSEQINKYNELITLHNQLVITVKEKISKYNKEVQDFNACIVNNT